MLQNLLNTDGFIFNGKFHTNHIQIGSFSVYYYAICIVTGMILCCLIAAPMFKRKGENPDLILDLMIAIVPSCIVGARLWYVIFDIKTFINAENPFLAIIDIRNGGLAIYGGLAAGALAIFVVCRIKKISVLKVFDLAAVVVPLGQMAGRWGNFFNQEVYGQKITDPAWQFFPFGVQIGTPSNYEWHYALFFYEGTLNFLLFLVLYITFWKARTKTYGYATGGYFIGYGIIRGVLEPLRSSEYNLPLFGKETSIPAMTLFSIILVLGGIILIVDTLRRDGKIKVRFVDNIKAKFAERKAAKAETRNENLAAGTERSLDDENPTDEKNGEKTDEKTGDSDESNGVNGKNGDTEKKPSRRQSGVK